IFSSIYFPFSLTGNIKDFLPPDSFSDFNTNISFANGIYIGASSYYSTIYYATNNENFKPCVAFFSVSFSFTCAADTPLGAIYIVGESTTEYYRSTNGFVTLPYTTHSYPEEFSPITMKYANGRFVLLGKNEIYYSSDAISWTLADTTAVLGRYGSLTYVSGNRWVAITGEGECAV
ncbi:MAG: hypothetical protein ACK42K_13340, partial [Leptonema sp. (in: bacteria)]